jgi:hypothetical protein
MASRSGQHVRAQPGRLSGISRLLGEYGLGRHDFGHAFDTGYQPPGNTGIINTQLIFAASLLIAARFGLGA